MKFSSDQNKSIGVKSGEYGGFERISHPNDLVVSWGYWDAVIENEGDYIFS